MPTDTPQAPPILDSAWRSYAQLDAAASRRARAYRRLNMWIAILGVLTVLLALVTASFFSATQSFAGFVLKLLFVAAPILTALLAALGLWAFKNGDWLIARSAAEEYLKEIYLFRTILQQEKTRTTYLQQRIDNIQNQLRQSLGREPSFRAFRGSIPPHFKPSYPDSDPGLHDLDGDEYFKYRLDAQLRWHTRKIHAYKREQTALTLLIVVGGAFGALLAAIGGPLGIWVALSAAITAAVVGWQQFRNLDWMIRHYSKVVLELTAVHDHWVNLEPKERTQAEFYQMVNTCENVLWTQNAEWNRSMRRALQESDLEEEASLVNRVMQETREAAARTKKMMRDTVVEAAQDVGQKLQESVEDAIQNALESRHRKN